jgi:long-chain acyl-CoA synthetase
MVAARLAARAGLGKRRLARSNGGMNVAAWLARSALVHADLPALARGPHVVATYRDFAARAARYAGRYAARGCRPGDRVAIYAANHVDYLPALFGAWWGGLVAVPINAKLHGAEAGWVLGHARARLLVADRAGADAAAPHAPSALGDPLRLGEAFDADPAPLTDRAGDDLAWLFYTSGTTGRPKGAMLTHRNLAAMTFGFLAAVDPTEPGDAILHAAPLSHGSGIYAVPTVLRAAVQIVPESGGFDAEEAARDAAAHRRVSMFAAPTMINRLVERAGDLDATAWRTIVWGGAPMYVEDALKALDRLGPRLAQIYGQGETPMTATVLPKSVVGDRDHPRFLARLGSAGVANPAVEVAVVDGEDRLLPPGALGEVVVRGDAVMAGYLDDPSATAKALANGWLHTGDVGAFDEDGFLTLKDRSKDLVICGGSNVYPREVEEVLLAHPGVREVSVIGRPDPEWGEIVVAYVAGAASEAELDALCLARIARFKRPKAYVFVEALPKNAYGKVLKTELRARDARRP